MSVQGPTQLHSKLSSSPLAAGEGESVPGMAAGEGESGPGMAAGEGESGPGMAAGEGESVPGMAAGEGESVHVAKQTHPLPPHSLILIN